MRSPLLILLPIILADLMGFSLVVPLLPPYARHYGFSAGQIGWLLAAYPLCQLIAGPILGRLSDRYGRRPVLVLSQAGTALSFLILGLSSNYWVMFLARGLDGASGGNFLVAQAYVADVTPPEERAKGYGLLGAAFGIGFVLGPILGAGLLSILPEESTWRLQLPFLVAAAFSSLAWLLVLFRLPESLPPGGPKETASVLSWRGIADLLHDPRITLLVVVGSLTALGFSALEGTFSLYLQDRIGWGPERQVLGYAYVGTIIAVVQGGLIRALVPRFGEILVWLVGLAMVALGLAMMAVVPQGAWPFLLVSVFFASAGQAAANPAIQSLLSKGTEARERGAVFGAYVSAQTFCRMVNYVVANKLLGRNPSAPYWESSAIVATALALGLYWAWRWGESVSPEPGTGA
ncbi:MAG: MFS transporter [Isosphaeraceae bacterium]